jgi:Zn-dependent protease
VLLEPQETPYDLRFRLGSIPVRVHPMFWLFTAILGFDAFIRLGFEYVLLWVACVFVSILIHELGHIFMGLFFGSPGYIVLYSFGGLAVGSNNVHTWWKRVLVSFAGPLAGFIFLAFILLGLQLAEPGYFQRFVAYYAHVFGITLNFGTMVDVARPWPRLVEQAVDNLIVINLFWGLLNLLPIFPLDGGQISRDILTRISPERGLRMCLGISFLLAALIAINGFVALRSEDQHGFIRFLPTGGWFSVILFAMLALESLMMLQQISSGSYRDPYDPWGGQGRPWER